MDETIEASIEEWGLADEEPSRGVFSGRVCSYVCPGCCTPANVEPWAL